MADLTVYTGPVDFALARSSEAIPAPGGLPGGCAYEIKVDGWRMAIVRGAGERAELWSRRGANLTERFPEVAAAAVRDVPPRTVVDGEVTVWRNDRLDWDELLSRMGSKAQVAGRVRVAPASYMAFDLLSVNGDDLRSRPYSERRRLLEEVANRWRPPLQLVPQTSDRAEAERWFDEYRPFGIEGLVVKGQSSPYRPGRRDWLKVKSRETIEGIVGAVIGPLTRPESIIIGRYTGDGQFVIWARSGALADGPAADLAAALDPAQAETHPWPSQISGFFGGPPVALTRVEPTTVVDVDADSALQGGRRRHAVRYVRRRPDLHISDVPVI